MHCLSEFCIIDHTKIVLKLHLHLLRFLTFFAPKNRKRQSETFVIKNSLIELFNNPTLDRAKALQASINKMRQQLIKQKIINRRNYNRRYNSIIRTARNNRIRSINNQKNISKSLPLVKDISGVKNLNNVKIWRINWFRYSSSIRFLFR